MDILGEIKQAAITAFINTLGHGDIFARVKAEIVRANEAMPNATGADKRHKVLADAEIIFMDMVEPVAESVVRLCLELAVAWLKAGAP
jgi:hypothetical protein